MLDTLFARQTWFTIRYNGETQTLFDANKNRVYPITYNGTTYLPVRAVSVPCAGWMARPIRS